LANAAGQEAKSLDELRRLDFVAESLENRAITGEEADLRLESMRNAALTLGAQHGYVFGMNRIKNQLRANADYLDKIWDFGTIMRLASSGDRELYLLPPVIQEVNDTIVGSEDHQRLRVADKLYRIVKEERLVLAPPNWRDYLLFDQPVSLSAPAEPLLPKTPEEKRDWAQWVTEGWEAGRQQAVREMARRFRQMGSDFTGMVRYMRLAVEGKIKETRVASDRQWVTGGGDQMRINERIYQVSQPASLDPDMNNWETRNVDPRDGYRYPIEERRQSARPGWSAGEPAANQGVNR
jgi:defect-in-organelle-trafficking protein DotC